MEKKGREREFKDKKEHRIRDRKIKEDKGEK